MKKLFTLLVLCIACIGLNAETLCIPKSHIFMTEEGLFVNVGGHIQMSPAVRYLGSGLYEVTVEGYCGRCGWPMENNKCSNQNCNGYGPRERD